MALVLYLLLASTVELGRLVFTAQATQNVARVAARELALVPLPPDASFEDALADPRVQQFVYDESFTVIDLDAIGAGSLDEFFATLPTVNQAMRPLMIFDQVTVGGAERRLLRMPGALVVDTAGGGNSGLMVAVPKVVARGADGGETIEWRRVLEELRPDLDDPLSGPFAVDPIDLGSGVVALRVNVPYQAAMLSGYQSGSDPLEPNLDNVIEADDSSVTAVNAAPGGLAGGSSRFTTYAGPYGLGTQYAMSKTVRPFRRMVTSQSIFRRELFEE